MISEEKFEEFKRIATPDQHGNYNGVEQNWMDFPDDANYENVKINMTLSKNAKKLPTNGYVCSHDEGFLCEHRVQFIIDFFKKADR